MELLVILLMFLSFCFISCTPPAKRPDYINPPKPDHFEHVIQRMYEDMTCQAFLLPLRVTLAEKPWCFKSSDIRDDSLKSFVVETEFSENELDIDNIKPGAEGIWSFRFSCRERKGVAEVDVEFCALTAAGKGDKWSTRCEIDQKIKQRAIETAKEILDRARDVERRLVDNVH